MVFATEYIDNIENIKDINSWSQKDSYASSAKWWFGSTYFDWWQVWEAGAEWMLFNIAKDLKDTLIVVAIIYMFILVLRLFFWQWTDDDLKKWRLWILWTSIWIVVMQMAYMAVVTIFNQNINQKSATDISSAILGPIILLLETLTSFIFIATAIMAFFKIIGSGWSEEWYKKWVNSIINAIVWFILVKISAKLVTSLYWTNSCQTMAMWRCVQENPLGKPDISATTRIVWTTIQYMTWFVGIITIILIIYAAFLLMTSWWDDTKVKKTKSVIKYIIFWMVLITSSVILFNFMLWRDVSWVIASFK
jgi:hypothetical protein